MKDMNFVNKETLEHLGACEELIVWFLEKFGSLPVSEIEGLGAGEDVVYKAYLVRNFVHTEYDERGNATAFDDGKESWRATYDDRDNMVSFKNSDGYGWVSTYDKNNKRTSFKQSEGYSWVATHDEMGNRTNFRTSLSDSWVATHAKNKTKEKGADKDINPKHYKTHASGVECIQITEHFGFCLGNAIKYIWRAGLKDANREIEDLEKAKWYLEREIERIKKEQKV